MARIIGGQLIGVSGAGAPTVEFVSPNGLDYFSNDTGDYFEDSGATTAAVDEADTVGAWKNVAHTKTATQGTGANEPNLDLDIFGTGKHAIFCGDEGATALYLDLSSGTTTGLNTTCKAFVQHKRDSGAAGFGTCISQANENKFRLGSQTGSPAGLVQVAGQFVSSAVILTPHWYEGVLGLHWDNTGDWCTVMFNDQEITQQSTNHDPDFGNGTARFGNYDGTTTYAAGWIGKLSNFSTGTLTEAQRRSEMQALGVDMGLVNSGRGHRRIVMPGNSHWQGTGSYNNPVPTQLAALLGTTLYEITNLGVTGETTAQVASRMVNTSIGAISMGNSKRTKSYAVHTPFVPNRINIQQSGSGWTVDEFAGCTIVFTSGVNAGMGALITSNTTDTLTLTSPGIAASPSAADTFRIFYPLTQRSHLIAIPYEITNDSFANADADGITAVSGVWDDCPIWQRFRCFVLALKAYGFKIIGCTNVDRTESGRDANYDTDEPLYNARILANAESLFDATYDAYTDLGVNTGSGNFLSGGVHMSNTGGGVFAAGLNTIITGLSY